MSSTRGRGANNRGGGQASSSRSVKLSMDSFAPSAKDKLTKPTEKAQITTQNKFTVLTPNNPLTPQNYPKLSSEREDLESVIKKHCKTHLVSEREFSGFGDNPHEILTAIALTGSSWINPTPNKTSQFYLCILCDTGSAEIEQCFNDNQPEVVAYSKLKIIKVLSIDDWKKNPNTPQKFSRTFDPPTYNYFDYQSAWSNVLFANNPRHSWYFNFSNCQKSYPNWFYEWFWQHGLSAEILPNPIYKLFGEFKQLTPNLPIFAHLLHFSATFGIAWLLSFQTVFHKHLQEPFPPHICSEIKVSWWRKFNCNITETKFATWKKSIKSTFSTKKIELPSSSSKTIKKLSNVPETPATSPAKTPFSLNIAAESAEDYKRKLLEAMSTIDSEEDIVPQEDNDDDDDFNPYLENEDMFFGATVSDSPF